MMVASWRDWVFSGKTFIAAMLALYLALAFDLSRPYWAMTTVYVVANPLSGATNSKALYRTLGTILGAAGSVVLVPNLVNAPELLILAVAIWAGVFCYAALLDRSPRGYVFTLAAYTLPLVALPVVTEPATIFDVALARSEEIILGILCASIVGTVIFPVSIGTVFDQRVGGWLADASGWAKAILTREEPGVKTTHARQRLAADITALDTLIDQLGYDPATRDTLRPARELRARLQRLLPILSSIADRAHALDLEEPGPHTQAVSQVMNDIAAWVEHGPNATKDRAIELRSSIVAAQPLADIMCKWEDLLLSGLCSRLLDFVNLWYDCLSLSEIIRMSGTKTRWAPAFHGVQSSRARHYDHGLMAFSAISAAAATFTAGMIWIYSGWVRGAFFVAMTTVACAFFAAMDRPATAMRTMLLWCLISMFGTGVYLYAVLPQIHDFEMIVLTLAAPFLIVGVLMPKPQLTMIALLLAANSAGNLAFQSRYNSDFATYVNEGMAVGGGLLFALIWTQLTRPFGAEISVRRLIRAGWRDIADHASGKKAHDHSVLTSRIIDRLGQIIPRIAAAGAEGAEIDGLNELRISYNIAALQRDRRRLSRPVQQGIDVILSLVATYYRRRLKDYSEAPQLDLCDRIDAVLGALSSEPQIALTHDAVQALVGLRRALFPNTPGSRVPVPLTQSVSLHHLPAP